MRWVVLLGVLGGCSLSSNAVPCESGRLCANGRVCRAIAMGSASVDRCVAETDITPCDGKAESDACSDPNDPPRSCHSGVCFDDSCGNGLVDHTEVCDDGNTADGDHCSASCQSKEVCRNAIVDLVAHEECDQKPVTADNHVGCSTSCKIELPTWQLLGDEVPAQRTNAALAYDVHRRRTVMFGGSVNGALAHDTHEWDGARWHVALTPERPAARAGAALAYDAKHAQVVMFSGLTADTWIYDGVTWALQLPPVSPPARGNAGIAYDSLHERVVIFGGASSAVEDDTWAWQDGAWSELSPASRPDARMQVAMAYDENRHVLVMFGGRTIGSTEFGDLWEMHDDTWAKITPTGLAPGPRFAAAMAYDPVGKRVILAGGQHVNGGGSVGDAWAWDGTTWSSLPIGPSGPNVMATDSIRQRIVDVDDAGHLVEWNGTTWAAADNGSFENLGVGGGPTGRLAHAVAWDPTRRELVLVGGVPSTTNLTPIDDGTTWVWNGRWINPISGNRPSARFGAAMAYDPVHDDTVLFGGCTTNGQVNTDAQTWIWKNHAWTPLAAQGGGPVARCGATLVFDAKAGNLVMLGGRIASAATTETWLWNGTTWSPGGALPAARTFSAAAYDPASQAVLAFGGGTLAGLGPIGGISGAIADTIRWDGSTWHALQPATVPVARFGAGLAWDAARRRLVLVGGVLGGSGFSVLGLQEAWEWDDATTNWQLVTPDDSGTSFAEAGRIFAPTLSGLDGYGVISIGGEFPITGAPIDDMAMWRLAYTSSSPYETCVDVDTDGDSLAGCADTNDCAVPCAKCGNGACDNFETCASCAADCGACPGS